MHTHSRGRRLRGARRRKRVLVAAAALLIAAAGILIYLYARDGDPFDRYPMEYVDEIRAGASEFSLDPAFVASVILAESSYNPEAVSSADARGLMQLLPSTAEWVAGKLDEPYDERNLFVPAVNIRYGSWYLKFLMDRYAGNMRNAVAAYHAGQGRVDEWLRNPDYSADGMALEVIASNATNTYVNKVLANYEHYAKIY
jgi:soluble lytic murein transglycosylase